ncbi:hypothetical protein CR205_11370 [Alteribacter lacisalsi]|uniref:Uncharacterized protein n=1 Tax=Alteribacter lacisalsi TaxID=2045244 RepID=A0A2W0H3B2_9BACI|nr:DUF5316 family protein [Alteribacter lacisalsi]PYZ96323.1 hypothetical protein CR205_11370 [Alteribacter lacisalsi]
MTYSFLAGLASAAALQLVMWSIGGLRTGYEISGLLGIGGIIIAGLMLGAFLAASREPAQKSAPDDREGQKNVQRIAVMILLFAVPHFVYAFVYFLNTAA